MSQYLIVNADDYGRTRRVSQAIRSAHRNGMVSSTTAMMNLPGIEQDLELALEECPRLGLGVHLTLTTGKPLLPASRVHTLTFGQETFPSQAALIERIAELDPQEAFNEWQAQVRKFTSVTERKPDHLDSHHHSSYFSEGLFRSMLELAKELGIPIRPAYSGEPNQAQGGFPEGLELEAARFVPALLEEYQPLKPDYYVTSFYDEGATPEMLLSIFCALKQQPDGTTAEIMTHPGYLDDELVQVSSYNRQRQHELGILTDPAMLDCVRQFELVNYAHLKP